MEANNNNNKANTSTTNVRQRYLLLLLFFLLNSQFLSGLQAIMRLENSPSWETYSAASISFLFSVVDVWLSFCLATRTNEQASERSCAWVCQLLVITRFVRMSMNKKDEETKYTPPKKHQFCHKAMLKEIFFLNPLD